MNKHDMDDGQVRRHVQQERTTMGLTLKQIKDGLSKAVCRAIDDYLAGLTHQEVARRDGVTERTAKRARKAAKDALRKEF
jgi:hypothetical protein